MIEEQVRDYLRTVEPLMALLNDEDKRVNMDWTGDVRATHVTLFQAGGGPDVYLPIAQPTVTIHCFGSTRPAAARVASEVELAIWRLTGVHAPLLSGEVLSTVYVPTADGVARYVVTTSVTARMAVPA